MQQTIRALCVFGTRPEAIKFAPVLLEMAEQPQRFTALVCSTGQHDELLRHGLASFGIIPDYDLDLMTPNQSLGELSGKLIVGIGKTIAESQPHLVLVQGDTTTTFCAALAASYAKVPVGHIEAGLRTYDSANPFPEENNRVLTDRLSSYFFAPTELNRANLLKESVPSDRVFVTGNTSIDALRITSSRVMARDPHSWDHFWGDAREVISDSRKPMILVTAHRRESFGAPFENICGAISELAIKHQDWNFVFPVHLNPHVREVVARNLAGIANVFLIEPLEYEPFVYLMNRARLLMTDSGGIQEEAPSLKKPVVVMREKTERIEAIEAGTAILVGTAKDRIKESVEALMSDRDFYELMAARINPYGDGFAAGKILESLYKAVSEESGVVSATCFA